MKPLAILTVADVDPDPDSGAAGTELRTIEALRKLGHRVDSVWRRDLAHRFRHGSLHQLLEQPRAYREAIALRQAAGDYDVLHVNQPYGFLAARAHRRAGSRALFVHRSHGYEPHVEAALGPWRHLDPATRRSAARRLGSRLLRPLARRAWRGIERFADAHVVSASGCADFLAARGVPREAILVSPQAPPDAFLDAPPAAWLPERARRLLYVGQFAFVKAPSVVAEVFTAALRAAPDVAATWVCQASHHGDVAALLPEDVRRRVALEPWRDQAALGALYDRHGLFLFPSFVEGFGKVLVEAMSRGLAVVATAQGGARDLIRPGENGLLAPVGDVVGLSALVARLLADGEAARRLGAAGRATVEPLRWSRLAHDLAEFYRRRLAAKRPGSGS